MSIDMFTWHGRVAFTDESASVISEIKRNLEASGYDDDRDVYRYADYSDATDWHELFGAWKQRLTLADTGDYDIDGYNDRYYDPTALFQAAAAFMKDGSFIAYSDEESDDDYVTVIIVNDKTVQKFTFDIEGDDWKTLVYGTNAGEYPDITLLRDIVEKAFTERV